MFTQRGFSLIEIMVVAGLMGIVTLGVVSISKIGLMGQKTVQAQDDARVVTDNVATFLTNPTACLNTLGGLNPVTGASFASIKDKDGNAQYTTGAKYGNKSLTLMGMTIGGSGVDKKTQTQQWVATGSNTGTAFLSIDWQQTGTLANGVSGPKDLLRFVLVNATINGSNLITACSAVVANVSSSGTGIANYLPIWATSTNLGNSGLYQNGANVGIGTITPAATLHALTTLNAGFAGRFENTDSGGDVFVKLAGSQSSGIAAIFMNGAVGIGTAAPNATLDVQGGIRAGASTTVTTSCGMGAANHEGTQRYNYTTHNMEYCNGTAWTAVGGSSNAAGIYMVGSTSSIPDTVIPVGIVSNTLLSYNPSTSAFTAPSDGNYLFAASTAACTGYYWGNSAAKFFVNGNQIGWEYNASNCNTGSFTAFYYMHTGDSVQGTCAQNVGATTACYFIVVRL